MSSRSIFSLVRCSIPRVSLIYRSRFYSTTPLISRTLILRNLISKPYCAISIVSASSKSLETENDKKCADENFFRALESEIASEEVVDDDEADKGNALPEDFQFEIIDNPKSPTITLQREYEGEQIEATVCMYFDKDEGGNDENEEDDSGSEGNNDTQSSSLSLIVTIDKNVSPTLNFHCYLTADDLEIECVALRSSEDSDECDYLVPHLSDLDERTKKAFHKYLATRGFKKSLYNYLHDYMVNKFNKNYFAWLKSFKDFIEK